MSTSTTTEPSVEEVERYDTDALTTYLQNQRILNLNEQHINVLCENEVAGYDFLRCKQDDLERYGLKSGPAKRISDFAIQLNSQKKPVFAVTKSPDRVCIFVDNSNFIAQGEHSICYKKPLNDLLYYDQITFDYGLLFKKVVGNRELESPGILVLIVGDGDYYRTLLEAIDCEWKVEVWFWKLGILNSLNNHEPTDLCTKHLFPVSVSDQFKISVPLFPIGVSGHFKGNNKICNETHYKFFVYATGPNSDYYNRMNTLEITCDDTIVEDKEIVESIHKAHSSTLYLLWAKTLIEEKEWFANLNLFSWIHRKGENITLYLNNERELNITKEWIVRERKEISIWEKKGKWYHDQALGHDTAIQLIFDARNEEVKAMAISVMQRFTKTMDSDTINNDDE
ncbi:hypothetical protein C1645_877364 [Glomus cerebriforme]|uniref:SAM domain-containing protein n=1 Tax=Glomus cerebriforme TaxID=658196 RepID=A0A397SUA7_9GLOM|nr:hypothetical protein C1645_877364 [Glomus cerebriforme]